MRKIHNGPSFVATARIITSFRLAFYTMVFSPNIFGDANVTPAHIRTHLDVHEMHINARANSKYVKQQGSAWSGIATRPFRKPGWWSIRCDCVSFQFFIVFAFDRRLDYSRPNYPDFSNAIPASSEHRSWGRGK